MGDGMDDILKWAKENGSSFHYKIHYAIATGQGGIPPFQYTLNIGTKHQVRASFPKDAEELSDFVEICFAKFNVAYTGGRGSVAHNPKAWVKIALKCIEEALTRKEDHVTFPNGCCTLTACQINILYKVVFDEYFQDAIVETSKIRVNDGNSKHKAIQFNSYVGVFGFVIVLAIIVAFWLKK